MSHPNNNPRLITPLQGLHALAEQAVFTCDDNESAKTFVLWRLRLASPEDRQKLWDIAASHGIERAIFTMRTVKDATIEMERLKAVLAGMPAGTVGAYEMQATLNVAEKVLGVANAQLEEIEKEVPYEPQQEG
jgi:hypothetical protein